MVRGWNPFLELRRDMERLFLDFARGLEATEEFPAFNAWQDEQNVYLESEMPGVSMSDLEITVTGSDVGVRGERKSLGGDGTFERRERPVGKFKRSLLLPVEVDGDKVQASLENGVLTVTLPKAATARLRRIEVRAKGTEA